MPMISDPLGGRSLPEWIGKTPDSQPPDRVRDRIFIRAGGICHISGIKIRPGMKWQAEHIKPLSMGGENRESNLAPALTEAHKVKTKEEAAARSKADRIRRKMNGTERRKTSPMPGSKSSKFKRRMNGEVVRRDAE
ncbi:HNH endonuclease [Roseibium algae]|uniref:HNH endonuclease n=1 Tax=Roseibium algae TaxID=3123038 RepID=A0ABU8TQJ6_9HYPH